MTLALFYYLVMFLTAAQLFNLYLFDIVSLIELMSQKQQHQYSIVQRFVKRANIVLRTSVKAGSNPDAALGVTGGLTSS